MQLCSLAWSQLSQLFVALLISLPVYIVAAHKCMSKVRKWFKRRARASEAAPCRAVPGPPPAAQEAAGEEAPVPGSADHVAVECGDELEGAREGCAGAAVGADGGAAAEHEDGGGGDDGDGDGDGAAAEHEDSVGELRAWMGASPFQYASP